MSTRERRRARRRRPGAGAAVAMVLLASAALAAAPGGPAAPGGAATSGRWLPAGSAPTLGRALDRSPGPPQIFADGSGLPPGRGSAAQGAALYRSQCASCHGRQGEGNTAPELVGGEGPLTRADADKTLATYWPYAPTLFDAVRRGMPPASPGRLTDDEVYALCAWLLSRNGLWNAEVPLDAAGLAAVRMPNRSGFVPEGAP